MGAWALGMTIWKPEYKFHHALWWSAWGGLGSNSLGYSLNSRILSSWKRQWINSTADSKYQGHCGGRDEGLHDFRTTLLSVWLSLGSQPDVGRKILTSSTSFDWPAISGLITWSFPKPWKPRFLYTFINFMLRQKCSEKCGVCRLLSTPNLPAKEMLPEETREDKSFYPDADCETPQVYEKFDHKWTGKYSDLFLPV